MARNKPDAYQMLWKKPVSGLQDSCWRICFLVCFQHSLFRKVQPALSLRGKLARKSKTR